jgi:uncharacterized protein DUF4386
MTSPKAAARLAGLMYFTMVAFSAFGLAVQSRIIQPGDAASTADNLRASAALFRLGFASDLLSNVSYLFTAMALYALLKHVNQLAAAAMVTLVAVSVAGGYLNVLDNYTAFSIAVDPRYTTAFGNLGSDQLVMLFTEMQRSGGGIQQIFWGLWLLPLGYLVARSGYFPKLVGAMLIIGGFGWIAQFFAGILAPDLAGSSSFLAIGAVAEFVFIGWLLIQGASVPSTASVHDSPGNARRSSSLSTRTG